ncbi:hypothetical protein F9802_10440 [Bacillus aerolatus]|uniref:Uncharacterized protein n=1 Tax=Bacillus aerolatus TaxID=2653354 RepID=A0A6I1FF15_9BACI|nr:hypothetical protein [Bacillus aerolatus]KAB7706607.1 hypothetical protein F9802_10440 [Bacillus aerolatus]
MKQSKQFIVIFFLPAIFILSGVAGFNYYMDPYWTYGHNHPYNDHQISVDEREQKTNQIYFQFFSYDTIILGSSRTTYVNQNMFKGMKAYNYAVNNMSIREYDTFLQFAKNQNEQKVKRVIIGMDFFKSSVQESEQSISLKNYEAKIQEPFYRARNLISIDIFNYSLQNFRMSKNNKVSELRVYDRYNVARAKTTSASERLENTEEKIERFRDEFYGKSYQYNPKYKEYLSIFKQRHPDVEFIIFTTPISAKLFQTMIDEGQLDDYQRWLRDVTTVFGGVYNFMYPNEVTLDINNYFDGHHFYPHVGDKIADRILQGPNVKNSSFGVYITNENIDEHLKEVERLAKE